MRSTSRDLEPVGEGVGWAAVKGPASSQGPRRNIFSSLTPPPPSRPAPAVAPPPAPPPPPKIPLAERVGHLRLVGILPGPPRQAVVEDPRSQKIYTLSAGQKLEDCTVAEVGDGGAVLSFEDERFELTL